MKYLRKFATEAEASVVAKPNVVLFADTKEVRYNFIKFGVYIQHINGELFTTEEWSANGFSNDMANGVAVLDSLASFVVAKQSIGSSVWAYVISNIVEGAAVAENSSAARTDFLGKINTDKIAATFSNSAANTCNAYIFPNGAKGYLPAFGEWAVAYKYKPQIVEAITIIGGDSIDESSTWSSTQRSNDKAWLIYWSNGSAGSAGKNYTHRIRAFAPLNI